MLLQVIKIGIILHEDKKSMKNLFIKAKSGAA